MPPTSRHDRALDEAYEHCRRIAAAHYENFTVGSWLLPRHLRRHIAAIYAFARTADDIADEGDRPAVARLAGLDALESALDECFGGEARGPIFLALADTAARFELPVEPFRNLLVAFRSDVRFEPFADFAALRHYCRHSADPVGHLILYLFGYRDPERQALSDRICTGLQLANFCQDLGVDAARGRLYVPLDEVERFGCTRAELREGIATAPVRRLIAFQVERARALLNEGLALAARVERRLAREVQLFAGGGLAILDAVDACGFDVFHRRPIVSRAAKAALVVRSLVNPERRGAVTAEDSAHVINIGNAT